MNPKTRRVLIMGLKFAIVGLALGYLIGSGKLNFSSLTFRAGRIPYVGIAFLCIALPAILACARWHMILKALDVDVPMRTVFRLGFIGLFFNTFMFGAFGGDVVKIAYIVRETHRRAAAVAGILFDRLMGLLGLLFVGGTAILLNWEEVARTSSLHILAIGLFGFLAAGALGILAAAVSVITRRIWALSGIGGVVLIQWFLLRGGPANEPLSPPVFYIHVALDIACILAIGAALLIPGLLPGHQLERFVRERVPGGEKAMAFVEALLAFRKKPGILLTTLAMSIVIQTVALLSIAALAYALGSAATVPQVFFAAPPTLIANVLPVPMGGLGVGEACFDALLRLARVDGSGAAVTGGAMVFLGWRILMNLFGVVTGLPLYLRGKKEIQGMREDFSVPTAPESM